MNILMKSKINRIVINTVKEHIDLFGFFDSVYLFGSALDVNKTPNDVDLLLIYSEYSNKIHEDLKTISNVLEEACGLPVDLTVLSIEEEKDTEFLKRISSRCLKLK